MALEEVFSFCDDWHRDDRASPLVRQYQTALDAILKSHPHLERCAVHCIQCGIRFLTHPRNAGRRDLRCPFGCRQHHRKQSSSRRSTAYYRTAFGKRKKKRLNARRSSSPAECQRRAGPVEQANSPDEQPLDELQGKHDDGLPAKVELRLEGVVLDEASLLRSRMLPYVRMVVNLIEGVQFSRQEIVSLLRQAMRQHSIAYRRRTDYVLHLLHQHPP